MVFTPTNFRSSAERPSEGQSFDALIDLLSQEEMIYREVGDVLEAEHAAMLRLDVTAVSELAARKETLGLRIKALDESRKILARRLGAQFQMKPDQLTVTALAEHAPAPVAARLRAVAARLKETVKNCQARNDANGRAAQHGLELVTGAMNHLIAQADPAGKVYQAGGKARGAGIAGGYATLSKTSGSALISRKA